MPTDPYDDIRRERARQEDRWGPQDHPDLCPALTTRGATPGQHARCLDIPGEAWAKALCRAAADTGNMSWSVILVEELAEAVDAAARGSLADLRAELVQVAAVAVAWIEALDRRGVSDAD